MLSKEQIDEIWETFAGDDGFVRQTQRMEFAQAIEVALRAQADARPVAWYDRATGNVYPLLGEGERYAAGVRQLEPLYTHPEASAQPMCVKCGDGIMAHDPGTCGNCHAIGAEASAPGLSDEEILKVAAQFTLGVGSYQFSEHRLLSFVRHLTRASAATVAEPSPFKRYTAFEQAGKEASERTAKLHEYLAKTSGEKSAQQQAEPRTPSGWRGRLQEMRDASYTYSQYPELAQAVFDSVIDALGEMEAAQKQELCDGERKAFEIALKQYAEACHRSESSSAMDAARARVCAIFYRAAQQQAEPRKFAVSEEWLSKRLAIADDADCAAGQPEQKRPCDTPPGCNGNNCLGCGEQQAEPGADERAASEAYDKVDRFLRNNLDDADYAEYSEALDCVLAAQSGQRAGVAEGWTSNHDANAALLMLDRLDVQSEDDARVDAIAAIIRRLAAAPTQQQEGV